MELELGLALPDPGPKACGELGVRLNGKRGFGKAFGANGKQATTLPLFVRGDDEGGDERRGGVDCDATNKRKRLVGWPPVKCAHRRGGGGGSGYVKVKMEGVAIGRKVEVSLHASYDDLRRTLDRMFPPPSGGNNHGEPCADAEQGGRNDRRRPYVVTYEDGEGDWLLVGDVPWEVFAKSVKQLKILA